MGNLIRDVQFQHGDKESQLKLLLDKQRCRCLVENFLDLCSAVLEFFNQAITEVSQLLWLSNWCHVIPVNYFVLRTVCPFSTSTL